MNCAQHTDTAAVAYCRTCGKALCESCKRDVQGIIFCESCLAARINPGASGNFGSAAGAYGAGGSYPPPPHAPEDASPGLALFLGFIPGVGAFYNGQFLKGFVHVIVMSTLIWTSHHGMGDFAGLLVAAWVFYMVFDAWTTAKARRFGLPIPDPLGLNAILEGREGTFRQRVEQAGERMGSQVESAAQNIGQHWHQAGGAVPGRTASNVGNVAPGANPGATPPPPGAAPFTTADNAASGAAASAASHATSNVSPNAGPNVAQGSPGFGGPQGTYYAGPQGTYYAAPGPAEARASERSPVGAIVLIGLGILLLLTNLGWFSFHWLSHFWPVILITLGLWLFIKRRRDAR